MIHVEIVNAAPEDPTCATLTGSWRITLSCAYPGEGWTDVDEQVVSSPYEAEKVLADMAARVFAVDDARFDGPGVPVDHNLSLTYEENSP